MLTWRPRLKVYKYQSRSVCTYNPVTKEAHSYNHWCFFKVIKGKNVFNNYRYSQTTGSHQWMLKDLLRKLNIPIHLEVCQQQSLSDGLNNALEMLYVSLFKSQIQMNRKGSRKALISSRKEQQAEINSDIAAIKKLGFALTVYEIDNIENDLLNGELRRVSRLREVYQARALERKRAKFIRNINNVLGPKETEAA